MTRIETKGQGFNQEKKDNVICKLFSLHHARHSNNFQIKMGENVCYVWKFVQWCQDTWHNIKNNIKINLQVAWFKKKKKKILSGERR